MNDELKLKQERVGFFGGKFLPLHNGHIYAINQAMLQVSKLYVVLSSGEKYDKYVCEQNGIKYMPPEERLSWLGKELAKSTVKYRIIHIEDRPEDDQHDWEYGASLIKKAIPEKITHVFSSEHEYTPRFQILYPGTKHIIIDVERNRYPISSTQIRHNPYKHWEFLPSGVRNFLCRKVMIAGTESCGKSTLTELLSRHYSTTFVREAGRYYCDRYSNQLTVDSFDDIAMEHWLDQRKRASLANKVLFVDSDAVVTQYYLNMYFRGKYSHVVDEIARLQDYDLILYLEPDVPWVHDGLRFAGDPETRKKNNTVLKDMYRQRQFNFFTISGSYDERFTKSVKLIDKLIA